MSDTQNGGIYPEGEALKSFVDGRKRTGLVWHTLFQAATIISIITLVALLYNVIISSFGYVLVQTKVSPESLVLAMDESEMLAMPSTVSSEDDSDLAAGIKGNPNAIGFLGYAYYQANAADLRALTVNGVEPSAQTAESGDYPFTRPLFIYTAAETLREKQAVDAFVRFYLSFVKEEIAGIGYFSMSPSAQQQAQQAYLAAIGQGAELPVMNLAMLGDKNALTITGSSTVYPLTREIAKKFRQAGYQGGVKLDEVGTSAGFELFCAGKSDIDIVNASRPINRAETEACQSVNLTPLELRVGTDALAIVVSKENDFLKNVTTAELNQIFTTAQKWSDVRPEWPGAPIERYIPGAESGTLDVFVEQTADLDLTKLSKEALIGILQANVSAGLIKRFESEQPFAERTQEQIYALVLERVVEPRVIQSWTLVDSIFRKDEIDASAFNVPNSRLEFRSWLNWNFISATQASVPELAGVRTAIFGSLWVITITILVSFPLGVGAAIYLEEYATMVANPFLKRLNRVIQTNINNLAGVPSIIYGMLGLAIFVRMLEVLTSGAFLGAVEDPTTANGRTIFSAGLTLALLILPLIIINAQEAIRAVPNSLRQAGMGLGATKWQTIWHHVLPNAIPGILTGNILAMSRAIGETAPLVVIGASTFITVDPSGPFAKFTTLPIQIYQWTSRPQAEFHNIAAAAIIVLLLLLLTLNASAVVVRNKFSRRLS